ncbi:tRNA(fMet)-specific endonuclease VapC [mine drainage metagenome]|uniref:tRNA(fMet)-specific endonuclease VapC n=1 Tax=mine drainage metagenome TaxID=410659 RepID=A0A1J5QNW6_9ZZZZ
MVKLLFDTNILIDYLSGVTQANDELDRYKQRSISVYTWMEVMSMATPQTRAGTEAFLASFDLLPVDAEVAKLSVEIQAIKPMKLPDAIIWATAQVHQCVLVTRNTKDIPADEAGVRVPYVL